MLKREGWQVGQEARVSVYRQKGLQLRMKVKRRKRIALLRDRPPLARIRVGAFAHDQMLDGRAFRILTVIRRDGTGVYIQDPGRMGIPPGPSSSITHDQASPRII